MGLKTIIFYLIAILSFQLDSYALSFNIHQLTSNDVDDILPTTHNGQIAWSSEGEIFYWDGGAIHQITNDSSQDIDANIHNGQIAWTKGELENQEIYLWNGSENKQITNNPGRVFNNAPSLYDGAITFNQGIVNSPGSAEIIYWDGSSFDQITNDTKDDITPSLYDGQIAWMITPPHSGIPGFSNEIFFWDGFEVTQVSQNFGQHPSLYDGKIAYHSNTAGPFQNFLWDGASYEKIFDDGQIQSIPDLWEDLVVWVGGENGFGTGEVYLWDGSILNQVTTNTSEERNPKIAGDTITWHGWDGNDWEIYYAKIKGLPGQDPIPEPTSLLMLGIGLFGFGVRKRLIKCF